MSKEHPQLFQVDNSQDVLIQLHENKEPEILERCGFKVSLKNFSDGTSNTFCITYAPDNLLFKEIERLYREPIYSRPVYAPCLPDEMKESLLKLLVPASAITVAYAEEEYDSAEVDYEDIAPWVGLSRILNYNSWTDYFTYQVFEKLFSGARFECWFLESAFGGIDFCNVKTFCKECLDA